MEQDEELKAIVERMVQAGESEENIALVIRNYKPKPAEAEPAQEEDTQGFFGSLGKGATGLVTDLLPAAFQSSRAAGTRITPYTNDDLGNTKSVKEAADHLFRKKIASGDIMGALGVGDEEAKQYITEQIAQPEVYQQQQIGEKLRLLKDAERERNEFNEFTKDVPKSISEISKPSDVLGYVGYTVGQTLPQMGLAILSGGMSGYVQEFGEIYDSQLRKLSEDTGQSIEELVAQGKDDATAGQGAALLAAGLDRVGLEVILKNFGKDALKQIIRSGSKLQAAKMVGINSLKSGLTEGVTETAQYGVEEVGSSLAAGRTLGRGVDDLSGQQALESFAAGVIGGGALGAGGTTIQSVKALNQARKLALINETIDQAAPPTPTSQGDVDQIDQTAQQVIADVVKGKATPDPTQQRDAKLEDVEAALNADNLAKAEGRKGLSSTTRQQLEDQQNRLKGKPTDAEKEAAKNEGAAKGKSKPKTILLASRSGKGYDELPSVYIRFGKPAIDENGNPRPSDNYRTGGREPGVSVVEAYFDPRTGKYIVGQSGSFLDELTNRKAYLVEGDFAGREVGGTISLDHKTFKEIKEIPLSDITSETLGNIDLEGNEMANPPGWTQDDLVKNVETPTVEGQVKSAVPNKNLSEMEGVTDAEVTSPEYNKAIEELQKMTKLFTERVAADPLGNFEAEYAQLAAAKQAARALAPQGIDPNTGKKSLTKKTPIQQMIERVVGIIKEPAKVEETRSSSMKPVALNQQRKDITEGVRRGAKGKNELVVKIQEALKEFNLTPRQLSTIMTKVRNTNLFTAGSISRLSSFIRKVGADSVYADKLQEASTLRSKLKKGRKTQSHTEKSILKEFAKIDPARLDDIDAYLKQANSMVERLGRAQDFRSIEEYMGPVQATVEQANQERDQERAEALAEDLGVSLEEAAEMLFGESNTETDNTEKNAAVRQALIEQAEITKNHLFNAWDEGELEADSEHSKSDIEAMKKMDTSLLSNEQLKEFIRVTDRIATNEDWGNVGRMKAISDAQQNFKKLEEVAKGFSILNLNWTEKQIDSLPMAVQAITGLPKDAALFQLYMGFKGVADASTRTIAAEERFVSGMNELRKKHKEAFTNDSILRQGIYSELIRYNEGADPTEAIRRNKEVIKSSIENLIKQGKIKEAEKIAQLYAPFKDVSTVEDARRVMEKIDKGGVKVVDYLIDQFTPYAQQVVDYRDRYFNKKSTKGVNYSGPRVWSKGKDAQSESEFNTLSDSTEPLIRRKVGSPKEINQAKEFTGAVKDGGILNFNKHFNAIRGLRDTVFAVEAMPSMLQVREMIGNKDKMVSILGGKADNAPSREKANQLYDQLFDKNNGVYFSFEDHAAARKVPDDFDRKLGGILNTLRKIGYTLSLSGISQIPKQATVLSNVAMNLGLDSDLLLDSEVFSQKEEFKKMLEGETLSLRGAQRSEFSLGEVAGTSRSQEFQNGVNDFISKQFEGWLGIKPMVKTDVKVAQMTWLAFYKQYLRQKGVDYKGLKQENAMRGEETRKEARAYAKQMVDTLQVVSNPAELGKQIKNQGAFAQLAKALLIPFGTFSSNAKSRMWADYRALITGNQEQRSRAAQDLGATLIEQFTFHSVSAALKVYLWSNIGQLVAGMLDLPEDKDRKEKDWESAVKIWKTRMAMDLLPLILTDPGEKGVIETLNYASDRLLGYKDPLYRFKAGDRPWADLAEIAGPYGVPFERLWSGVEAGVEAASGTRRRGDKAKKLTPEQERMAILVAALYGLHLTGKMPADVIYAIDKERRLQKPGRRKTQPQQYIQ